MLSKLDGRKGNSRKFRRGHPVISRSELGPCSQSNQHLHIPSPASDGMYPIQRSQGELHKWRSGVRGVYFSNQAIPKVNRCQVNEFKCNFKRFGPFSGALFMVSPTRTSLVMGWLNAPGWRNDGSTIIRPPPGSLLD